MIQSPKEILDTMLESLGFEFEIAETESETGLVLHISTPDKGLLIGPDGKTLEDLQFLLNRILQAQDATSPKAYVDVEHYRKTRSEALLKQAYLAAERVRASGKPMELEPMNAYDRRVIHTALKDDPEVMTWSSPDEARVKSIVIKLR